MAPRRRMLCVFAHPDDECYGPGGVIAQCALDGGEVFITTFTAGEAGSIGVSRTLARDELARRRRQELAVACDALGVTGHRILGAPDGSVAGVDPDWAVREILSDIRRVRPQVVLTFHHRGVSGHPDHIAVAGFLDQAFAQAGDDGPRVYYEWGIARSHARLYERPNLALMEDDEIAATVPIAPAAMDRKIEAILRHETQLEFFDRLREKVDYRTYSTPEHYARRRSRIAGAEGVVDDLFDGIPLDGTVRDA